MKPDNTRWLKRAGKGAWFGLNILLPLSETRRIATTVGTSWQAHLQRIRGETQKRQGNHERPPEQLSFEEAVAASGQTREALQAQFFRRKCLCLCLTTIPLILMVALLTLTLLSGLHSLLLLLRVGVITLTLVTLACLPFLQALVSTWRLWQLRERRLSTGERGGFRDFVAERGWFISTLTPER